LTPGCRLIVGALIVDPEEIKPENEGAIIAQLEKMPGIKAAYSLTPGFAPPAELVGKDDQVNFEFSGGFRIRQKPQSEPEVWSRV